MKIKCWYCGNKFEFKRKDLDPKKNAQRIRELCEDMCRRCFGMMRGYPMKEDAHEEIQST